MVRFRITIDEQPLRCVCKNLEFDDITYYSRISQILLQGSTHRPLKKLSESINLIKIRKLSVKYKAF